MERKISYWIGIVVVTVILLSSMGTVVAAEKVSQYELVQECKDKFDTQAYADNDAWCNPDWVPEDDCVYSGCWDDIVQDKWRCINAYETDMVNVPGYLECVNPHMDRYLECLKKANEEQRSIRVEKRDNNKGAFEPNFKQWRKDQVTECQKELFPAIETCQERACIVYCIGKGAPGGEWSGSSWRGSCKCNEISKEISKETNKPPVAHASVTSESRPEPVSRISIVYGENITLSSEGSYDPDGKINRYAWYWDNGKLGSWKTTIVINLPIGEHSITLKVQDNKGAISIDTVVVAVTEKKKGKLLFSRLYTPKAEYDIGNEVDVFYSIKNVGTEDVDEYQVEYSILDPDGKTVYKHKGNVHSMATGKEQEWYSSSKWNVPSNAKSGKYTIEALLRYSSGSDKMVVSFTIIATETAKAATVKPATVQPVTSTPPKETIYNPTDYDLDDLDENTCSPREYAFIDKTRDGTMYISCRCKPGYIRVGGGCTFDLSIGNVLSVKELRRLERAYRALDANQGALINITKDGETIKLCVLRRSDYSLLYTLDGETWDSDIAEIVNPSTTSSVGTLWDDTGDAINPVNWFEASYKDKDKQMQYEIASDTLKLYKEDTKKISQYAYEYYSDAKDKKGAIKTLLEGELIKGGAEMAGIETDLLKYTMNFPGQAVTKFADEAQIQQFADGFFVYVEKRETTQKSPQEIMNCAEMIGTRGLWGIESSFGEVVLSQLYEEAYLRYLARMRLQGKK